MKTTVSADIRNQDISVSLPPEREIDVLRRALAHLRNRLPKGWSLDVGEEQSLGSRRVDAIATLTASDGSRATAVVEAKRLVATRDVPAILGQLEEASARVRGRAVPMVVARYLPPSVRSALEDRGAAYADVTGNLRLILEKPSLYVRDVGAERDPWRGPGRPRGDVKGPAAARVVRALADFCPPTSVVELVKRSGASTGATYRVVQFLVEEALVERESRGPIVAVEWRKLIERWSQDYGFQQNNQVAGYLEPRGLPALQERLGSRPDLRYALTGSLAAASFAPYAPTRLAMLYVDDLDAAAGALDLRETDAGTNVLLACGEYDVVFERTLNADGLRIVSPSQAAVDLLSGPGRNPSEGEALLDWMQANEPSWRR